MTKSTMIMRIQRWAETFLWMMHAFHFFLVMNDTHFRIKLDRRKATKHSVGVGINACKILKPW